MGGRPSSSRVILCVFGRWRAKRGGWDLMDGMVVIGQRSSMSTIGANNTKSNFSNQEDAHIILNFKKTYTCCYLNSFAIPWLFAYLCKSKLPPLQPISLMESYNLPLIGALDHGSLSYDTFCKYVSHTLSLFCLNLYDTDYIIIG